MANEKKQDDATSVDDAMPGSEPVSVEELISAEDLSVDEQQALLVRLKEERIQLIEQREAFKKQRQKLKEERKKAESQGSSLGTSRGIETMFRTSYRQHVELSGLADNKANIMISINGIIISILIAAISPKIDSNPWLLIPTSALLIGCMASLIFAVLSARPRVNSEHVTLEDVREDRKNILFFGNFVNMHPQDYLKGMIELVQNTDRLYHNMMRDIYGLGTVLQRKFFMLRISYNIFMVGLGLGVVLFIGVYVLIALGIIDS